MPLWSRTQTVPENVCPAITLHIGQQRAQALKKHAESVDEILAGRVARLRVCTDDLPNHLDYPALCLVVFDGDASAWRGSPGQRKFPLHRGSKYRAPGIGGRPWPRLERFPGRWHNRKFATEGITSSPRARKAAARLSRSSLSFTIAGCVIFGVFERAGLQPPAPADSPPREG